MKLVSQRVEHAVEELKLSTSQRLSTLQGEVEAAVHELSALQALSQLLLPTHAFVPPHTCSVSRAAVRRI